MVADAALWTKENLDRIEDGEAYPDGTIRFGKALTLKDGFYRAVMPQDAAQAMKHQQALKYAEILNAFGHNDWELANEEEGMALYDAENKGKLKGTFNRNHGYWLSKIVGIIALVQCFGDGDQYDGNRLDDRQVRCVRRFTI